jgi:MFS superfamily sulfate permease-like transporter
LQKVLEELMIITVSTQYNLRKDEKFFEIYYTKLSKKSIFISIVRTSQEFVAIGLTNILGSFFHAYPVASSLSCTAIKSDSGARTPLAGIFSGILVIVALYSTAVFYYMPDASS